MPWQTIRTKLLPASGGVLEQLATLVGPVLAVLQLVEVKALPALAGASVHAATRVGPVVAVLHVVAVKALPAYATAGAHAATSVGPVDRVLQVIVVKALPALAVDGAQVAAGVGPVATVLQVVTPGTALQEPGATGVQTDVAVLHVWSCDVLALIWVVLRLICAVVRLIWKVLFISGVANSLATWVVMSILPIVPATPMPAKGSANQMWPSGPLVSGPGLKVAITAGPVTG
jgi:hypothetical protein